MDLNCKPKNNPAKSTPLSCLKPRNFRLKRNARTDQGYRKTNGCSSVPVWFLTCQTISYYLFSLHKLWMNKLLFLFLFLHSFSVKIDWHTVNQGKYLWLYMCFTVTYLLMDNLMMVIYHNMSSGMMKIIPLDVQHTSFSGNYAWMREESGWYCN